jgi:LysM repeat protein
MATKTQIDKFINKLAPIVVDICKSKSRKVLPSVCIAQACYETGYGTTDRMMATNGLFGIKVGKNAIRFGNAWKGSSYNTKTKEYYIKTKATIIKDNFRSYDNIRDSVEDYYDILASCSRYSKAIGVTDYKKAIKYIIDGGYATDPDYIKNIISIIEKRELTKYDHCIVNTVKSQNVAVDNELVNTKHTIGEKVNIKRYYSNSMANYDTAIVKIKSGIISKIKYNVIHPYLVYNTKGELLGWCGDEDIFVDNSETTYTIKSGDTTSKIAAIYNTTPGELVKLNKSKYPNMTTGYIRVGWVIKVK